MSDNSWLDKLFGAHDASGAPQTPDGLFDTSAAPGGVVSFTHEQDIQAMDDLLGKLTSMELPDAIDMIMLDPTVSDDLQPGGGFARYAARLFADVGASRIRQIAASNNLSVIQLSNTGMFWMRFPYGELADEDLSYVLAAEAAMNRLLFIKNQAAESAQMVWTEENCFIADNNRIESIAYGAEQLIKGLPANPLLEVYGTEGRRGGEWDVRTRFALATEQVQLPYRLSYIFACNVAAGLFAVDYTLPLASWLPQRAFDQQTQTWVDVSQYAPQQAARYGVALAALLASIAFGTSVGISRVRLQGHARDLEGDSALTLYVDRLPFVSQVVPLLASGNPQWLQVFIDQAVTADPEFDKVLRANYHELIDDQRSLPDFLQEVLYATTASELDVLSDLPTDSWDTVHAAEADRQESPLAAIAVLEDVAAQADQAVASLPDGVQPLYCSDAVARFLLPLVNKEPHTRFVRYSDSGFRARSLLCDVYCDMGDIDRALAQAEKCIELAPTSPVGYTDIANVLFAAQRHAEAVPFLESALRIATQESTVSFVYYRLAFALWQSGRRDVALACYVLCQMHGFGRPEVVAEEMHDLLAEMGNPDVPTPAQARDVLFREGIAVAPTAQTRQLAAKALIGLVDNGFFEAAAPLARTIGTTVAQRDELFAVATSLH